MFFFSALFLQSVDKPKDWYKTMFKQIHVVPKPGKALTKCVCVWAKGMERGLVVAIVQT